MSERMLLWKTTKTPKLKTENELKKIAWIEILATRESKQQTVTSLCAGINEREQEREGARWRDKSFYGKWMTTKLYSEMTLTAMTCGTT